MLSHWLLIIAAAAPDGANADIRPLLRSQGFEWTLEKADSRIEYVGDIGQGRRTYNIYLYNGVNRENSHGINFLVVILNRTTYLGVYDSLSAQDCRVERQMVVCKTEFPGRKIRFTKNGPPFKAWIDGAVVPFELAPKFRAN